MSKNSLITSEKLYYKLKWDQKADTKKATITFLNLGKMKTISYHDWIPLEKGGEIPWHRVYKFHYQNEVLWDRDEKFMNIDLLNKEDLFSNIEMLKYENKKWDISKKADDKLPDEINIITFNCLMDIYEKHITNSKNRLPIIIKYLEKYNADIICLQEITIKMKQFIMKQDFIQKNYYITSNEPKIFGQVILSKFKPLSQNLVTLNGNHMKKYLHLLFKNTKDEEIEIYNIHLTSNEQINSEEKRNIQINEILNQIKFDKVILAGDFNSEFDINTFHDSWKILKPKENGYTVNYVENELMNKLTKTFTNKRIDKILFRNLKPLQIELAFNQSINKIFPSDHYGLLSKFSLIDEYQTNKSIIESNTEYNDVTLIPGNILCLILSPFFWDKINNIRKTYDDNFYKIPPHVTLFQRFVEINKWYNIKKDLSLINETILFNKLEIFKLSVKFVLVLTTDDDYKINQIRSKLENKLNINQNTKPHITLGEFDTEKKAMAVKNNFEKVILNNKVEVNLNNASYMKKINDKYLIYDTIGSLEIIKPVDLIKIISSNIVSDFDIKIIGSRAFGIKDSDHDIVIISKLKEDDFYQKFITFSRMTPYIKYSKLIESKMNYLNIITSNNKEINLIYTMEKNNKIDNKYINDSINHIIIIKNLLNEKFNFFCECYSCIKSWAIKRQIYGSKYGYLNGIAWLYLTLNIFIIKNSKNKKHFIKNFFDYYISYDWKIPININNMNVNKEKISDNIIYISCLTMSGNIVRTITHNSWKLILNEFQYAHESSNLNQIYSKKEINNSYLKITVSDQFIFNRIDKKNKISSDIWKLNIKFNVIPHISWKEDDNTFIYIIEIVDVANLDNVINYFKKFNTIIEYNYK